jgi:hypothetical protein
MERGVERFGDLGIIEGESVIGVYKCDFFDVVQTRLAVQLGVRKIIDYY